MNQQLRVIAPSTPASWSEDDIKAMADNDRRVAMEMATRKYRDRLFYHAFTIVKDYQEAYDVIQEVFIKAIRERRFFDPEFRMKAWLFRVTSNLCFNIVRDRRRRGDILLTVPRKEHAEPDQLEQVFQGEQRSEMLEAIERMSDDHRQILMLRYYNDLSYAEIADVLQIKLGTVMSRLSRARCRLQSELEAQA